MQPTQSIHDVEKEKVKSLIFQRRDFELGFNGLIN